MNKAEYNEEAHRLTQYGYSPEEIEEYLNPKITMEIVRFCAIECKLQMSGELSVWAMIEAWRYAQEKSAIAPIPTVSDVLELGRLVEPNVNSQGFRKVDVRVGWDIKMDHELVPSAVVNLMENIHLMSPEGFFKDYEDVHPFRDGNGRTGVILFNWLNGTLDHPVWAPNFWNDSRRTIGYGA